MRYVLALLLLLPSLAFADIPPVPDDTLARGHYVRGAEAYNAGRYEEALVEFEAAHHVRPMSAFDYNIAKCLDRLNRRAEAVEAYGKYLRNAPPDDTAAETRARIEKLQHEIRDAEKPPAPAIVPAIVAPVITPPAPSAVVFSVTLPPRPSPRRFILPGAVGGGALALAAIGAGLLGSTASAYGSLDGSCAPNCSTGSWASLPAREHAGEALLGIAGAVAIVDVVLWVRAMKRGK
jgi:tetratricopeptide (TPR) repeat protein